TASATVGVDGWDVLTAASAHPGENQEWPSDEQDDSPDDEGCDDPCWRMEFSGGDRDGDRNHTHRTEDAAYFCENVVASAMLLHSSRHEVRLAWATLAKNSSVG